MNQREMLSEKAILADRAKALWAKKEKETRAFTDPEFKEYQDLQKKIYDMDDKIKRESERLTLKRNGQSEDKTFNRAIKEFSLSRLIRGKIFHQKGEAQFKTDDGIEREVSAELVRDNPRHIRDGYMPIPEVALMKRTAVTTADSSGGALVSELVRPEQYVEGLYAGMWSSKAGATMLSDLQGDTVIPGLNQKPSFSWVTEGSNFPEQDMTFNKPITLKPKFAGAIQDFAIGIFYQSQNDSIESFIRQELTQALSTGIDDSFLNDDGTTGKPKGLLSITGISEVDTAGANGAKLTLAKILETEQKLLSENQFAEPVWVTNSNVMLSGRNQLRFAVNGAMTIGTKDTLVDNRMVVTNSVKSNLTKGSGTGLSQALLLIPRSVVIGRWSGGLQISVNTLGDSYWKSGSVGVRVLDVCDLGLRRAKDVVNYKNIVTTLS